MRRIIAILCWLPLFAGAAVFSPSDLSFDARQGALGRLGVASPGGGACVVNAALCAGLTQAELAVGAIPWLENSLLATARLGIPMGRFGLSVQWLGFQPPDLHLVGATGAVEPSYFPGGEHLAALALGARLVDGPKFKWALGVQGLLMLRSDSPPAFIGDFLDLGVGTHLQWKLGAHAVSLGVSIDRALGKAWVPGERVRVVTGGLEATFAFGKALTLSPGVEAGFTADQGAFQALRTSLELAFFKQLSLRAGWTPMGDEEVASPLSVGAGLRLGSITLDYALKIPKSGGFMAHAMTVSISFPGAVKK